jgi:hypothetical protein
LQQEDDNGGKLPTFSFYNKKMMVEKIIISFFLHKKTMIVAGNKIICPFTIREANYYMSLKLEPRV